MPRKFKGWLLQEREAAIQVGSKPSYDRLCRKVWLPRSVLSMLHKKPLPAGEQEHEITFDCAEWAVTEKGLEHDFYEL